MIASANAYELIREFEGCKLKAYLCPAGRLTIGYGHTAGVTLYDEITEEEAEDYLGEDVRVVENALTKKITTRYGTNTFFTQNEFDALVSFCFNLGIGAFDKVTANGTRTKKEIADKMLLYVNANGVKLSGLVRRRTSEHDLFVSVSESTVSEKQYTPLSLCDMSFMVKENFRLRDSAGGLTVKFTTHGDSVEIVGLSGDWYAVRLNDENPILFIHKSGLYIK